MRAMCQICMSKFLPVKMLHYTVVYLESISTLNLLGRALINLTLMESPINVAMLQWGIVGVK